MSLRTLVAGSNSVLVMPDSFSIVGWWFNRTIEIADRGPLLFPARRSSLDARGPTTSTRRRSASGRSRDPNGVGASEEPADLTSVPHPAGVVGPHRDLDPVAGADLGQQARDVGLGGRQADEEIGGDL